MAKNRTCILAMCLALGLYGVVRADDDDDPKPVDVDVEHHDHHDDDDDDHGIKHFKIYVGPAYVAPMGEDDITFGSTTDAIKNQKHVGWNFGAEGRFGKLIGIELDYVNSNQDVEFAGSSIGDANFQPLTATLNFHLIPSKVFDLYVGPSYTYVNWGDVHLNVNGNSVTGQSGDLRTDSAKGWGASLGIDFGIGKYFAVTAGLKYLNVDMDLPGFGSSSVNPLVARLGVAGRF